MALLVQNCFTEFLKRNLNELMVVTLAIIKRYVTATSKISIMEMIFSNDVYHPFLIHYN
ncbi:hypothetical protein Q3304_02295 [Clostridioides sp. GD02377]|uniref:hypothetical protein n=1 Tax=unclassified Clostridioides TaxID=2635829 RepID=UPI0038AE8AC2